MVGSAHITGGAGANVAVGDNEDQFIVLGADDDTLHGGAGNDFIAGGPGQAAVESYPLLDAAFTEVRKHRNVVLVDQRGTGKSNPLDCPLSDDDDAGDDEADDAGPVAEEPREEVADRLHEHTFLQVPRFVATSIYLEGR